MLWLNNGDKMTGTDIQKDCIQTLQQLGFKIGENLFHVTSLAAKRCPTIANFPDLFFFNDKHTFALEVKGDGDTVKPGQRKALQLMHRAGYVASVIESYDEFLSILKDYGVIK
jgi:hypothetical protein